PRPRARATRRLRGPRSIAAALCCASSGSRDGQSLHRRARDRLSRKSVSMRHLLSDLARNLASGSRVVFGQPVDKLAFRIGLPQLLVLFVFSALLDAFVDTLRREPGATLTIIGLVGEGF